MKKLISFEWKNDVENWSFISRYIEIIEAKTP